MTINYAIAMEIHTQYPWTKFSRAPSRTHITRATRNTRGPGVCVRVHDARPPLFLLFSPPALPFCPKDEGREAGQGKLHPIYRYSSPLIQLLPFSSFSPLLQFFPNLFFLLFLHSFASSLFFFFWERSFMDDLFYFHCFSFLNLSLESKSEKWGRFLFVEN